MYTTLTKDIDGHKVITGIDKAIIDPVATKNKILNERSEEIQPIADEVKAKQKAVIDARANRKFNVTSTGLPEETEESKAIVNKAMEELEESARKLSIACNIDKNDMIENAIYFEPKNGEQIISDDLAESIMDMSKTKEPNTIMTLVDNAVVIVPDYRGKRFWEKRNGKWLNIEIKNIDIKPSGDAKSNEDLTSNDIIEIENQFESDRISRLSPAQKLAEKNDLLSKVLTEAAVKKSEYEIIDDPNALAKSQEFYRKRVSEIEDKYR